VTEVGKLIFAERWTPSVGQLNGSAKADSWLMVHTARADALRVVDPAFDALFFEIHGLHRTSSVVLPGGSITA